MAETPPKIGNLATEHDRRDAIHIAVIAVVAAQDLNPGARVAISNWHWATPPVVKAYQTDDDERCDGIVDPYLVKPVKEDERFWLFMLPGTITGLRHEWSHPVFPTATPSGADRDVSERWLRDYAERYRADYDEMVCGALTQQGYCFGDDDGPPTYTGAAPEFWHHIEIVTGKKFSEQHRENTSFRCAC